MIPKIKNRIRILFARIIFRIKRKFYRGEYVAHHGLQRAGTNFLLLSLKKIGLRVINEYDPERNDPTHKHFRWYEEKKKIPPQISHQYSNNLTVQNISDLNQICRYPKDTRHIVIQKNLMRHCCLY
jgi:hypothetical protein